MGSSNIDVRASNRKSIINTLFRQGPMTKQELASTLDLSLPTVWGIIKELTEKGLITKGEILKSSGGRPPTHITPVLDAKLSIGVEISYKTIRLVLLDLGPNIFAEEKHHFEQEMAGEYGSTVTQLLKDFIEKNVQDKDKLLGVGIALQTPLQRDAANKESSFALELDELSDTFGMPFVFCSPAKMAAIAQIWALGECNDFVYLMLNTTVGGGIVINHNLFDEGPLYGFDTKSAEFGHMTIVQNGEKCSCGQKGCFESYCSSIALEKKSGVSLETFFKGLDDGVRKYKTIWEEYLGHLVTGINNLRVIFGLDIIIGGSLSVYLRKYEDEIKNRLAQCNPFDENGDYMKISDLGEYGPAIGAAMTQVDRFLD